MLDDIEKVLISEARIRRRLAELARAIKREFGQRELTVVSVLNGSLMFTADLVRQLSMPLRLDYDLEKLRFAPSDLAHGNRPASLWRYSEVLPIEPAHAVSLCEGYTPLLPVGNGRIGRAHV